MSAAKHTPGPWRLTMHGNIVSTHGPMVAAVVLGVEEIPSESADGCLIASAPDLLEEHRCSLEAFSAVDELIASSGFRANGRARKVLAASIKATRAVIAKAEGGQ